VLRIKKVGVKRLLKVNNHCKWSKLLSVFTLSIFMKGQVITSRA